MFRKKLKKTPLFAGLTSKQKNFSNCLATYHKELYLLFEKPGTLFQSEYRDRLETPSPR